MTAPLLVAIVGSAWILAAHFDRSWWPPDEGQFAHVAERMLDGEVLHVGVRDPHTDYGHVLNAAALAVFGRDLVSLRYVPAAASLCSALLVWLLLRKRDAWLAACAALAATAFGFVQFPNPTPNWYGPLLTLVVAINLRSGAQPRALAVGAAVGVLLGFRQLTGVFVGIGTLGYLLVAPGTSSDAGRALLARGLAGAAALALAAYLLSATDWLGWLLFGVWPVALLGWCAATAAAPDRVVAARLWRFAAGSVAGLLPMLIVHALVGSPADWWRDVVENALTVRDLPYLAQASYADWLGAAGAALAAPASFEAFANGIYWIALPLVAAANGILLLGLLMRAGRGTPIDAALPFLACFHALVSVINQIPIYLYYGVGLSLAGLVWSLRPRTLRNRLLLGAAVLGFAAIAVRFHAAQPHTRTLQQAVAGERVPLVENRTVPRAQIWMEADQERVYGELIARIHALTRASDLLWVVPNDAEVYFLARRESAVDFWSSALGIGNAAAEAELIRQLLADPPALIVHARGDKSTTPALLRVLDAISDQYTPPERVHYFELMRRL